MRFRNATPWALRAPCVKHNFLVKDVKELASTIKKAFYRLYRPPGPVLVDIPKDVTANTCKFSIERNFDAQLQPAGKATAGRSEKQFNCCLMRSVR